jgi:hypothetical protein
MSGIVDTLNVNGGSGADNLDFADTANTIKVMNINLGTGTDSVDFTYYDAVGDNKAAYDGLVINLSSSAVTFDAGTATAASVASGKAVGYDDDAVSTKTNTDAKGVDITITNVETVTGTGAADYIVANSTGTSINGNGGADTIVLGAGADTVTLSSASAATVAGMAAAITITSFSGGSDDLVLSETAFGDFSAGALGAANGAMFGLVASTAVDLDTTDAQLDGDGDLDVTNTDAIVFVGTNAAGNTLEIYFVEDDDVAADATIAEAVATSDAVKIGEITLVDSALVLADITTIA